MRYLLLAGTLAAGLILGCVPPQDLIQRKPTMDFAAKMEAREAVTSISAGWSKWTSQISVLPNGDGYTAYVHDGMGSALAAAVIQPEPPGCRIRFWGRALSPEWMSDPIKACQAN